jgi:hypothetical protein
MSAVADAAGRKLGTSIIEHRTTNIQRTATAGA